MPEAGGPHVQPRHIWGIILKWIFRKKIWYESVVRNHLAKIVNVGRLFWAWAWSVEFHKRGGGTVITEFVWLLKKDSASWNEVMRRGATGRESTTYKQEVQTSCKISWILYMQFKPKQKYARKIQWLSTLWMWADMYVGRDGLICHCLNWDSANRGVRLKKIRMNIPHSSFTLDPCH
jgi:hypothetical protein